MTHYEKKLPALGKGDEVKYYDDGKDGHPIKWVTGIVTEGGDESFVVQWEDLPDPTEYEFSKIEIIGNQIFENGERGSI